MGERSPCSPGGLPERIAELRERQSSGQLSAFEVPLLLGPEWGSP